MQTDENTQVVNGKLQHSPALWGSIALLTAMGVAWYFQAPRPRLLYELGEPIQQQRKINISPKSPQPPKNILLNIQQIRITNTGNAKAERIVVKFHKSISDPVFSKYSEGDKVEQFLNKTPAEIIYPLLPPNTAFSISFSTPAEENNNEGKPLVEVSYDDGKAEEAVAASSRRSAGIIGNINLALIFLYIFLVAFSIRDLMLTRWERPKHDADAEELLNRSRPWYALYNKKWNEVQFEALHRLLNMTWFRLTKAKDIDRHPAYKILNAAKPINLLDEDWKLLQQSAILDLMNETERFIYSLRSPEAWIEDAACFSEIRRPHAMPEEDWSQFDFKISARAVERIVDLGFWRIDASAVLKLEKPKNFNQEMWESLQSKARYYQIQQYGQEIDLSTDAVSKLSELDRLCCMNPFRDESCFDSVFQTG